MNNTKTVAKKIILSDSDIELARATLRESKIGADHKTLNQVLRDLSVVKTLTQSGDQLNVARSIDHFVYIQKKGNIAQFHNWAIEKGYVVVGVNQAKGPEVCISFTHIGSTKLSEIILHTIPIHRASKKAGGKYDGWGTYLQFKSEDDFDECHLVNEQQSGAQEK
jgi:regulator of RNase E activity RraB